MMRWGQGVPIVAIGVVVAMSAVLAGVPVASAGGSGSADASANEAPLADAGLDRSVTENATVYLDATGSRDPDGEIERYRWRIEQPDGDYTTPVCETCGRTDFVPREPGLYNATVVVTDDDGATSSDTLRVRVSEPNGPSVTVAGPDEVVAGRLAGFSASVSAGGMDLAAVVWRLDDRRLNRTTLAGESAVLDHGHVFGSPGEYTLRAEVVDRLGRKRTATKKITVVAPSPPSDGGSSDGGGSGGGGGSGSSTEDCYYPPDSVFSCEADSVVGINGGNESVIVTDSDRDGEVTVNGETFETREGDSVSINRSTWEDHYQPDMNDSSPSNGNGEEVHYQPGIEQGPNDEAQQIVNDWDLSPVFNFPSQSGESDEEGGSNPWEGNEDGSTERQGLEIEFPERAPERVREDIRDRINNEQ